MARNMKIKISVLTCIITTVFLCGLSIASVKIDEANLKEVFPEAVHFEPVKSGAEILYYKALDKDNKFLGVVFRASGKGYFGTVETISGMTKDGVITAVKVLNPDEAFGMFKKKFESSFMGQFKNKNIQDFTDIQAITGATISSNAVIDSVKDKAAKIKVLLK